MKWIAAELAAHFGGPATTLAASWRISRTDGIAFHLIDHDHGLSERGNARTFSRCGSAIQTGRAGVRACGRVLSDRSGDLPRVGQDLVERRLEPAGQLVDFGPATQSGHGALHGMRD